MPHFYTAPRVTVLARPVFVEPAHLPVNWIGESTDGEKLAEFADLYNASWFGERHGHKTPNQIRAEQKALASEAATEFKLAA